MHTTFKHLPSILFALSFIFHLTVKTQNLCVTTQPETQALSSWIKSESQSMALEFAIKKYNLDRDGLMAFVSERGGLTPKQEEALLCFASDMDHFVNQTNLPLETMVRLVIDGINPLDFTLGYFHNEETEEVGIDTKALIPSSDNQQDTKEHWIHEGTTKPSISPEDELPFYEFEKILSQKLRLCKPLTSAVNVFTSRNGGNKQTHKIIGNFNMGTFLTYIEGHKYPVIVKLVHKRRHIDTDEEALALWATHKLGLGPEFLGKINNIPGFADCCGLVFTPASGRYIFLNPYDLRHHEYKGNRIEYNILKRLQDFNRQAYLDIQILLTKTSGTVIDPIDPDIFADDYKKFLKLKAVSTAA